MIRNWTFDEDAGQIAQDIIGDTNGIIHGAHRVEGVLGNALEFDGIDDYIDLYGVEQDFSQCTVMLWFKTNTEGKSVYGGFSDNTIWQLYQGGMGDGIELCLATIEGRLVADFNLKIDGGCVSTWG